VTVTPLEAEHEQFYINIKHDIFMAAITERAANRCRWLRFRYLPTPACEWSFRRYEMDANIWVGDGVFPNLEGIDVRFPMFSRSFNNACWSRRFRETPFPFPKLRELSLQGLTPYQMKGYSDLVRLDLTCSDLCGTYPPDFLASCPSLQDIHIAFYFTSNLFTIFPPQIFTVPSVRDFHFELFVNGNLKGENYLKYNFSQLVFVNLPTLHIHIEFLSYEHWPRLWDDCVNFILESAPEQLDFGKYLKEIIREGTFPAVESLRVSFASKFSADVLYDRATFAIPVHFLPALTRLELQSNLLLVPELEEGGGDEISAEVVGRPTVMVNVNAQMLHEEEWLHQIRGKSNSTANVGQDT